MGTPDGLGVVCPDIFSQTLYDGFCTVVLVSRCNQKEAFLSVAEERCFNHNGGHPSSEKHVKECLLVG